MQETDADRNLDREDDYDYLSDIFGDDDDNIFDFNDDEWVDEGPRAPGRVSKENQRLLQEGFQEVINIAKRVAAATNLAVGQVFDQWSAARSRKHLIKNMWNLYLRFFKKNALSEIGRLSDGTHRYGVAFPAIMLTADFVDVHECEFQS